MEDRERGKAVFSTANGKYAYREVRRLVRPIFREDSCSSDDAKAMAQTFRNDFPKQCKVMTASTALHIEDYFDPVDIQSQGRAFLHEVLMHIVLCNFQEGVRRVHDYVNKVKEDAARFEHLKIEDLESDVFTKEELDLVGYDNTLPAALFILKQSKFPQASHSFAGLQPGTQFNNSSKSIAGADSGQADAAKVVQTHQEQPSYVDSLLAPTTQLQTQLNDNQSLSSSERHLKTSEESALQSSHPHDRPLIVNIPIPRELAANRYDLPSGHEVLQPSQRSISSQNTHPVVGRHEEPKQAFSPHNHTSPSSFRQRDIPKLPRGIPNPTKKVSDDIRRQRNGTGRENFPLPVEQTAFTSSVLNSGQSSYMHYPGSLPQLPIRANSSNFQAPSELHVHKRLAAEIPATSPGKYSSLDSGPTRPEVAQIPSPHATQPLNPSDLRYASNPFSCSSIEELEGRDDGKNRTSFNLTPDGRQLFTQEAYVPLEQHRTDGLFSMAAIIPAHSMPSADLYHVTESAQGGNPNRRHDVYSTVSKVPSSNTPRALTYPQVSVLHGHQTHPENQKNSRRLSEAQPHPENEAFIPQLNYVQNVGRIQHHNQRDHSRNVVQQVSQNQRNRGPSLQKPHPQVQRPVQFPENCTLHISGLPAYFNARDVWEMLSPVPGLKWTADPKKPTGKDFATTRIAFYEPWFAVEALNLLPKTHFSAMQGRFLYVRPFEHRGSGPMRLDTASMAIKPGSLQDPSTMYAASVVPRGIRTGFSRDENSPSGHPSQPGSVQQVRGANDKGRNTLADVTYDTKRENEGRRAEEKTGKSNKDNLGVEATERASVTSNGSPVKRKKSTRNTLSKGSKSKSVNLSPSRQSKDPKEIPKEEVYDLVLEAAEPAVPEPSQSKHSTVSTDVQSPTTGLPLEADLEDRATTANIADTSEQPQISDLQQRATNSAEPVAISGDLAPENARQADTMEQDKMQQPSATSLLPDSSTKSAGRIDPASAKPEVLVGDSALTHPGAKTVLEKGDDPDSESSNVTEQQAFPNSHKTKQKAASQNAGNQSQIDNLLITKDSAVTDHQGKSQISSATNLNKLSALVAVPRHIPGVNSPIKKVSLDGLPHLAMTTASAGGESSATVMSPTTLPTTTLPTDGSNTPDVDHSCASGNTVRKDRGTTPTSDKFVDSERLRCKLEAAGVRSTKTSQFVEPVVEGDGESAKDGETKPIYGIGGNSDHEIDNTLLGPSDQSATAQQDIKSKPSELNLPQSGDGTDIACESLTKISTDVCQSASFPTASVEKHECSRNETLSQDCASNAATTTYLSADHQEQHKTPLRSGSIVRSLTPAPIITRRKKQKKIGPTPEEQDNDHRVPHAQIEKGYQKGGEPQIASDEERTQEEESSFEAADKLEVGSETPAKDGPEVFFDPKTDSAQSLKFLTPPTTPYPQSLSSPELSPTTPIASTNDHPGTPRKPLNPKSKTNRKKNRPGKKKSKSYAKPPLDMDASGSAIVDESGPSSSSRPRSDVFLTDATGKTKADSEATKDGRDLKGLQNQSVRNHREEGVISDSYVQPCLIISYVGGDSSSVVSKDLSLLRTADSDDHTQNKTIGQLAKTVHMPVSAMTGREVGESVAAQELLSRSSTAAIARIEDLCRKDDETRTQNEKDTSTEDYHEKGKGMLCSDCAQDIQNREGNNFDQTSRVSEQSGDLFLDEYHDQADLSTLGSNTLEVRETHVLDTSKTDEEAKTSRSPKTKNQDAPDSAIFALDTLQGQHKGPMNVQSKAQEVEDPSIDDVIKGTGIEDSMQPEKKAVEKDKETTKPGVQPTSDESDKSSPTVEKSDKDSQRYKVNPQQPQKDQSLPSRPENSTATELNQSKIQENLVRKDTAKAKQGEQEIGSPRDLSKATKWSDQAAPEKPIIPLSPRSTTSSSRSERLKASGVANQKSANVSPTSDNSSIPAPSTPAPKPRPLPTPKLSYATALSSPAPAPKVPSTDSDAWTVKGEEAWGTSSSSNNEPGEGSRASAGGSNAGKSEDEEGGKHVWTLARRKRGGRGGSSG